MDSTQSGAVPSDAKDVFDSSQAQYPTRFLDLSRIVDMLHVTNAPRTVDGYRAAMENGDRFPPISLVRLVGIWFVADGHKRLTAYRSLGAQKILVEVWPLRRWLRDQGAQARASARRWAAAIFDRDGGAPGWRDLLAIELAHVRRMMASLISLRGSRRPR